MAEQQHQVRIEKTPFSAGKLDSAVLEAFARLETSDPQFGAPWLENLAAQALDESEEAVLFIASTSAQDFVALPMKLLPATSQGHALATFYTSAYCPVVHSSTPQRLFSALFKHLRTVENLSSITLAPLAGQPAVIEQLQTAMGSAGWRGVHRYFCFGNWRHQLDDMSYADYLASRPSKVRNTVKRRTRKFLDGDRGQLELVEGGATLDNAIERFVAVYNRSWKTPEPFPEFMPSLLHLAARKGWLRLGIASYDGQAVACQLWLVAGDTAYIFKLAYDEQFRQLSPGTVLTAFLMEQVIDRDNVSNIDYLSGDDNYKQDWMTLRRERQGLAAYNPRTPRGAASLLQHSLKATAKKWFFAHSRNSAEQ